MKKQELIVDFVREFSVWQQELEVIANLEATKEKTEMPCSEFLFNNSSDAKVTAYRLKDEREQLPSKHIQLALRKDFSKNLLDEIRTPVKSIREFTDRVLQNIPSLNSKELLEMHGFIIELWPAYLYGYNLFRFADKGIFKPKSEIEKENLEFAIELRKYSEGIYDNLELILQKYFETQKDLEIPWQYLLSEEIFAYLDGKKLDIIDRKLPFVVDRSGLVGVEFDDYLKNNNYFIEKTDSEVKPEIKGMVAMKGKVTGRVRIVSKRDISTFKSFQDGEVLVSMTTSPQFIPYMKKASAIVTDFGGLASHAAIVAREFKIPCVVGTKNATALLKDGDLVEVDAELGIITRL